MTPLNDNEAPKAMTPITDGDFVHQIVAILVKNNVKITPETTLIHDLLDIHKQYANQRVLEEIKRLSERGYYKPGERYDLPAIGQGVIDYLATINGDKA